MSHWNHRVVEIAVDDGEPVLGICEVHYDDDDVPHSRTDPVGVTGSTFAELQDDLDKMARALKKPRLKQEHFVKGRT